MEFVGSRSWRFAEDTGQATHVALYVRDALDLQVPSDPWIPPPLAGAVPDRRTMLDPGLAEAAAREWSGWWRELVSAEMSMNGEPSDSDPEGRNRRFDAAWQAAGEPPYFGSLAGRPALRPAAEDLFAEGSAWAEGARRASHPPHGRAAFSWDVTREVAEDVAFDRGVEIGSVRGVALVLAVDGSWWQPLGPGVVLCSRAAAQDPRTGRAILREAFESGLLP